MCVTGKDYTSKEKNVKDKNDCTYKKGRSDTTLKIAGGKCLFPQKRSVFPRVGLVITAIFLSVFAEHVQTW